MIAAAEPATTAARADAGISPRPLMILLILAGFSCCVAMSMPQVHIVAYCGDLGYATAWPVCASAGRPTGAALRARRAAPVLRGMLLTRVSPTYLRAAIGGNVGEPGQLASTPLWWPATKIAGRYLGPYLARTRQPQSVEPLQAPTGATDDPREVVAGHREARELALSFALADANSEDYRSALRWLELVEQLDGRLPPGYDARRDEWRTSPAITARR